jgi:putative oxidoreductase
MSQIFLIGRLIVGSYYLFGAYHHFADVRTLARHAGHAGVPVPEVAVIISGILLAIAGLSLLLGVYPRVGVAALVLFLLPVTIMMHGFWNDRDPMMRQMDMVNFTKNLALLGSALMFLAIPHPWPYSLERRFGSRWHVPIRMPV